MLSHEFRLYLINPTISVIELTLVFVELLTDFSTSISLLILVVEPSTRHREAWLLITHCYIFTFFKPSHLYSRIMLW